MARGIRALMKFGARLNAAKEGGPIVRVDIVVGGSGFGHQAPLALARPLARPPRPGASGARVHDQFHLTAAPSQARLLRASEGGREAGRQGGSHLARSVAPSPTARWERKEREGDTIDDTCAAAVAEKHSSDAARNADRS